MFPIMMLFRYAFRIGIQNQTKDLLISIPPIHEQNLILSAINIEVFNTEKYIDKIKKEITLIKEYREALISDLVLGKRSVDNF